MRDRDRSILVAILAVAVGLRLWRVTADLPYFVDEAAPLRTALAMWPTAGPLSLDPQSFVYPSLSIYLHLLVSAATFACMAASGAVASAADWWLLLQFDPSAAVVSGRLLHVAAGVATVALAAAVAERLQRGAGLLAAAVVALSPVLVTTSRVIYTDTLMALFGLWSLERAMAWSEAGGRSRLALAVVFAGLAAGTKYSTIALIVPLGWVVWRRLAPDLPAVGRTFMGVAVGMAAVFLLTTPYALADPTAFVRALATHRDHLTAGHFGPQSTTGAAYVMQLLAGLGPIAVLLIPSAVRAAIEFRGDPATIPWSYLLTLLVPLAIAPYALPYYVIPVLPIGAALAASTAIALLDRWPAGRRRVVRVGLLVVALGPLAVSGLRAAASGATSTRVAATEWLERHVASDGLVITEAWGSVLHAAERRPWVEAHPLFRVASADMQRRFRSLSWRHEVELPLTVTGRAVSRFTVANGARREIEVFPSVFDVNRIAYDRRVLALADWIVTSGAVRHRLEAHAAFDDERAIYRLLDSTAVEVMRFEPDRTTSGPAIAAYRLGPATRLALGGAEPLPALWWTDEIPMAYRRAVAEALGTPVDTSAELRADGTAPLWVRSLRDFYGESQRDFALDLAGNLVSLGRCDLAQPLVEGTLLVMPRDERAADLVERCTGERSSHR